MATELNGLLNQTVSIKTMLHHIMSQYLRAKQESFGGHPLGNYVRKIVPDELAKLPFIDARYIIEGSVGRGNWAKVPWIAILDQRMTTTVQKGIYIVYLFAENMESVYLTLNQGVTIPIQELGRLRAYQYFAEQARKIRAKILLKGFQTDKNLHGVGQDYQASTIAYVRYDFDNLPENDVLIADLKNMLENYQQYADLVLQGKLHPEKEQQDYHEEQQEYRPMEVSMRIRERGQEGPSLSNESVSELISHIKTYIVQHGFTYPELMIENFFLSLKTRPFVILAGVSGTGKTKLVRLFAEAVGATEANGQFAQIPVRPDWSEPSDLLGYTDLSGTFRAGPLTKVLWEASQPANQHKPYFICLDEMNLARVEHYFSDLLSILETKRWANGQIITDTVLPPHLLSGQDAEKYGHLIVPENVYIIGTVNMDETTYPFSKKVLDRANTIEFHDVDLLRFPSSWDEQISPQPLPVSNSPFRSQFLTIRDAMGEYLELIRRTTEQLVQVNRMLENIHAHIGYRIRDTICFYMIYNQQFGLMEEHQAFDFQLLQKILPRIQGSSMAVKRCLIELLLYAIGERGSSNDYLVDATDLIQAWERLDQEKRALYPQSARKIATMLRRLEEDGFTSFWLS